jgi:hypothetical protein
VSAEKRDMVINDKFREIELSPEEMQCLKQIASTDDLLLSLLTLQQKLHGSSKFVIKLDRDNAEKLRDLLTKR